MLTKLLNFFGIKTQEQKAEEYRAAAAKCPYLNNKEEPEVKATAVPQPLPEPVPAPAPEPVTMATTSEPAPSVTTIEVKPEPAGVAAGDTLTINLTPDTIKFSTPETLLAPKRGRKSKGKSQAAKPATKPATKPAVIKGGRKKK